MQNKIEMIKEAVRIARRTEDWLCGSVTGGVSTPHFEKDIKVIPLSDGIEVIYEWWMPRCDQYGYHNIRTSGKIIYNVDFRSWTLRLKGSGNKEYPFFEDEYVEESSWMTDYVQKMRVCKKKIEEIMKVVAA